MATWASKQAGQSIRKEDLQRALQRRLRGSTDASDAAQAMAAAGQEIAGHDGRSVASAVEALWDALSPAAAFERTADAVARGNRKVFEEIGYQFARFLALFADGQPDDAQLTAFCDGMHSGDPPDGQRFLRQAFTHYHQALAVFDVREKAELLLLANLEIGFHEQTRLQPEIVEAMNAPVYDPRALRRRLVEELFPDPGARLRYVLAGLAGRARPLLQARDHLADEATRIGRLVVTEHMMTLSMPDGQTLLLGHDLTASFPDLLSAIQLAELRALLAQIDPTPDSTHGTGAADWGNLPQRMHFITDLFRAYHLDSRLFDPPFSPITGSPTQGRLPAPGRAVRRQAAQAPGVSIIHSPQREVLMSTGKKILRWLIIVVAVLVLVGSIAGIVGAWWLHNTATDVTLQAFSIIDTAVGVVDTGPSRADDLVQRGRTEVQQVEETIVAVGTNIEANKPLLTALSSRINERLTPTVEQVRTTLAPVTGTIRAVRALVDFVNAFPFIRETPPAVEELETALNRLDEASANARQVGDTIRTTVTDTSSQLTGQTVERLTSLTSGVDSRLAEAQSAVDTLQTEMAALQERLALLRSRLLLIYSLAAVGSTLLLFWVIYSQIVVIRHQRQLLHARAAKQQLKLRPRLLHSRSLSRRCRLPRRRRLRPRRCNRRQQVWMPGSLARNPRRSPPLIDRKRAANRSKAATAPILRHKPRVTCFPRRVAYAVSWNLCELLALK